MVSSMSSRAPDAIAMVAPGRAPLSYLRLTEQIDVTIAVLRTLGIEHDDRVATVLPDGPEAAVGALSIACAAACAPLDPRSGPAEVEAALLALRARAVIVWSERASPVVAVARRYGLAILELRPLEREAGSFTLNVLDGARECAPHADGPEGLALVLRTSGTTAASKLVPLTHANLRSSIARVTAALALGPRDRYLNVTPMFYSQGIMLTLASLGAGSSVVCTAGFDAAQFFKWLEEFEPTWYSAAPAVHHALLAQARSLRAGHRHHQLRFIRSAAAPLPGHVRQDLERLFDAPVINAYGMTECYPIAVTPMPPLASRPGSVGVAAGTEIRIVNERGDAMPHGGTG
jgi:acyl-CoA synthetase (AMP-forming)/AMP-acid ligase II